MENVLKDALTKLATASQVISDAQPDSHARSYDINIDGLRRKMFDANQAVQSAKLAIEEALGSVEVTRVAHAREAKPGNALSDIVESHESFGILEVTKPTGLKRLVGTMTDSQPSFVKFKIYRSDRHINAHTHSEHYFQKGPPLVELSMSVYQWAEMMSSMQGQGTCCTLDRVMGVYMEPVPEDVTTPLEEIVNNTRKKLFDKNDDQLEKEFWADLDALSKSVEGLKLSQKSKSEVTAKIRKLKDHTSAAKAASAWATERFAEETEKAISTAKVEIAAAIDNLAHRRGLAAFKEDMATLGDGSVIRDSLLTEGADSND